MKVNITTRALYLKIQRNQIINSPTLIGLLGVALSENLQ